MQLGEGGGTNYATGEGEGLIMQLGGDGEGLIRGLWGGGRSRQLSRNLAGSWCWPKV